ncbi:Uncharacterised protein g4084 [Pycnogonum litorale]
MNKDSGTSKLSTNSDDTGISVSSEVSGTYNESIVSSNHFRNARADDKLKSKPRLVPSRYKNSSNSKNESSVNASLYRSHAGKPHSSSANANSSRFNLTPMVFGAGKVKRPNDNVKSSQSTSHFASTPMQNKPNLSHNASAICVASKSQPTTNPVASAIELVRKQPSKLSKNGVASKSSDFPNTKSVYGQRTDIDLTFMYDRYLQALYIKSMHEYACTDQNEDAQCQISGMLSLISELQDKEEELKIKNDRLNTVKLVERNFEELLPLLKDSANRLSFVKTKYDQLTDVVDTIRHQLILKDFEVDDDDQTQIINVLEKSFNILQQLYSIIGSDDLSVADASEQIDRIVDIVNVMKENQVECRKLMKIVNDLTLEESSRLIDKFDRR